MEERGWRRRIRLLAPKNSIRVRKQFIRDVTTVEWCYFAYTSATFDAINNKRGR